jgi:hypothetical protein
VSNAEISAYLLMAAGLVWILTGFAGLLRQSRDRDILDE